MSEKIAWIFRVARKDGVADRWITVEFDRPDWWADSNSKQRRKLEGKALYAPAMNAAYMNGFRIQEQIRPVCECIVQKLPPEERDPFYRGASNTCLRCGGPMPA